MFDVQEYLNLPEAPCNCVYEEYREKILINPLIGTHLLKHNHKEEMKYIHTLHICLYDAYGENWVDKVSFIDGNLRDAIRLIFIKDYPGKDVIVKMQKERRELFQRNRTTDSE